MTAAIIAGAVAGRGHRDRQAALVGNQADDGVGIGGTGRFARGCEHSS
ncbi:MAG: hypothetical protein ABSD78_14940 [Acidimicrobiales bacterium]|jgi:hypothetical protein